MKYVIIAVIAIAIMVVAVICTSRKKKKNTRQSGLLNSLPAFKRALIGLYKEELAIKDGRYYGEIPKGLTMADAMLENGLKIFKLKEGYQQFEGKYDEDQLHRIAEEEYREDLMLQKD